MESKWALTCERLKAFTGAESENWCGEAFACLQEQYSQQQRFYHNFEHIEFCLQEFEQVRSELTDPLAVELALWFHDLIYFLPPQQNEHKSAAVAYRLLIEVNEALAEKVKAYIEWTDYGKVWPESLNEIDFLYMRDIDYSAFARDSAAFKKDSDNLGRECPWKSRDELNKGRRAYLNSLITSDESLFKTEYFIQKCERQAQANIRQALAEL